MRNAVLFFIFCVLLCEVSPKVPVRKEDLLNKKAALTKQFSPNVPKWEDIAKLHSKEKSLQNKSKSLLNLLKVVTAKEVDVPDTSQVQNYTITNTTASKNVKSNLNPKKNIPKFAVNNTQHDINPKSNNILTNITVIKTNYNLTNNDLLKNVNVAINSPLNNTSVSKTIMMKKYPANETIGGKLALLRMKNTNTTKEKPNIPEVLAPAMIPIFKPMPSSTKNTIPQPVATELVRKDNFVSQDLSPEQLKDLDHIELNTNFFDPLQNKAILNPQLANAASIKEISDDVNVNSLNPQNSQSGQFTQIPIESKLPETQNTYSPLPKFTLYIAQNEAAIKENPNEITLRYVDPQNTYQVPNEKQNQAFNGLNKANIQSAQKLDVTDQGPKLINTAVTNQLNQGNIQSIHQQPIQYTEKPEVNLSLSIPRNANTQSIPNGDIPKGYNLQLHEQLEQFDRIQSILNQQGMTTNKNDLLRNYNDMNQNRLVNQHVFANSNGIMANRNEIGMQNLMQANIQDNYQNSLDTAKLHIFNNPSEVSVANNVVNPTNSARIIPNAGIINQISGTSPEFNQRVDTRQANVNTMARTTGFNLPCMKASDVLEEFGSTSNQRHIPKQTPITENPLPKLQCDKPIILNEESSEDESVAIVFKPKNISLLKFYGDLLKKITLTVLVPYHISKLTS